MSNTVLNTVFVYTAFYGTALGGLSLLTLSLDYDDEREDNSLVDGLLCTVIEKIITVALIYIISHHRID
jgi:hypothetical protein